MAESLKTKIDQVRAKVAEHKSKDAAYKQKLESLKGYTTSISNSYVTSLDILLDVSSILSTYNTLVDSLLKEVQDLSPAEDLQLADIQSTANVTIARVTKFLADEKQQLVGRVAGISSDTEKLKHIEENINKVQAFNQSATSQAASLGTKVGGSLVKTIRSKAARRK
jgi:chromosome segregation ATPase